MTMKRRTGYAPAHDDLRSLIGQTLCIGIPGTALDDRLERLIRELRPGGLVVLPRNVASAAQLRHFITDLQDAAAEAGLPPLLIAVDQEGGNVARLSPARGFTPLPSAMTVAATREPRAARALASVIARECAAVGITMVLAPVADVTSDCANTVIGTRSYGDDAAAVAKFVEAAVDGLQANGTLATAKHFPGHGPTAVDSHLDLPILAGSLDELERRDLVPFRAAIGAGVAGIMTGHLVSALDSARPATVSGRTIRGFLRGVMGHDGLVVTDALEMRALATGGFDPARAAAEALAAGADVLVFAGDEAAIRGAVAEIANRVSDRRLTLKTLRAARSRIERARLRVAPSSAASGVATTKNLVGCEGHRRIAAAIAAYGLGVTDPAGILPLAGPIPVIASPSGIAFAKEVGWPLLEPHEAVMDEQIALAVVSDPEGDAPPGSEVARRLGAGRPFVLVLAANPFVLADLSPAVTVVRTFAAPPELWPLVTDRLLGRRPPDSLAGALAAFEASS